VLAGQRLIDLVSEYGDGLFFENIRDWLGSGDDQFSVNNSIIDTIQNEPSKMLERNNGITVRAASVKRSEDGHTLKISRGAIVNGCQTTMCLWQLKPVPSSLQVAVKVVQVADPEAAWSIAKSANYQNDVGRIELELARYLRPQVVTRAAAKLGEGLKTDRAEGLTAVLRSFTQTEVSYQLIRYLFLGLFSNIPSQLFQDNYTRVRTDVLSLYWEIPDHEDHLFGTLFAVIKHGREALKVAVQHFGREDYATPFSRLLDAEQPKYQAYLLLLALCANQRIDLSESADAETRSRIIYDFLSRSAMVLNESPRDFLSAYLVSYNELVRTGARAEESADKTLQRLSGRIRHSSFHELYLNICMHLQTHAAMKDL